MLPQFRDERTPHYGVCVSQWLLQASNSACAIHPGAIIYAERRADDFRLGPAHARRISLVLTSESRRDAATAAAAGADASYAAGFLLNIVTT